MFDDLDAIITFDKHDDMEDPLQSTINSEGDSFPNRPSLSPSSISIDHITCAENPCNVLYVPTRARQL